MREITGATRLSELHQSDTDDVVRYVYSVVYGEYDDKRLFAQKTGEIHDWLVEGVPGNCTLDELAEQWREYDTAD